MNVLDWIKKYWKILIGAIVAVFAVIIGLVINKESRRIGDAISGGISVNGDGIEGLASGLGRLEEGQRELERNQQSARDRIIDIEAASQRIEEGQRQSSDIIERSGRTIDSATNRLDKLDSILGIDKNP